MRKRLALVVVTLVTVLPALSQRPNYDPMPRKPAAQSSGFLDSSLGMINPKNTDYGCQIDTERQFVVEQSLKNLEFWIVGITVSLLIVSFSMLLHQSRERDRREIIAAGFLAHCYNAWVDARSHAENAIRRHNELVKRTNAAAESTLRAASQERDQAQTETPKSNQGTGAKAHQSPRPGRTAGGPENGSAGTPNTQLSDSDYRDQINTLQQQLDASREREANLRRQLSRTKKREQVAPSPTQDLAS
jgi:hypothetical protein